MAVVTAVGVDQQHGVGRDAWLLCSASGSEFNDDRVGRAAAVWLATHQRRQDVRSRLMAPSLCHEGDGRRCCRARHRLARQDRQAYRQQSILRRASLVVKTAW